MQHLRLDFRTTDFRRFLEALAEEATLASSSILEDLDNHIERTCRPHCEWMEVVSNYVVTTSFCNSILFQNLHWTILWKHGTPHFPLIPVFSLIGFSRSITLTEHLSRRTFTITALPGEMFHKCVIFTSHIHLGWDKFSFCHFQRRPIRLWSDLQLFVIAWHNFARGHISHIFSSRQFYGERRLMKVLAIHESDTKWNV